MRPAKELKGFKKILLKAGEKKSVTIPVKVQDMSYWDEKSSNWKVDPGKYTFSLGTSAGDIQYLGTVKVK